METNKEVVGYYVCWGCHQQFVLYAGQRRRYCEDCVLVRQKEKAGTRPNKQNEVKVA